MSTGSKQFFSDGKYVGDIPASDDIMVQAKAAIELMKAKGLYRKIAPAETIFGQATAFATTAAHLFNNDLRGMPPPRPASLGAFVVNAAFAVELYLKALHHTHPGKVGRTHDLLHLFCTLPDDTKQAILREFSNASPRPENLKDLASFQAEIERIRHAFMDWRYLHEKEGVGEILIPELIFVMNVLHNTCRAHAAKPLTVSNPRRFARWGRQPLPGYQRRFTV
jgi:HEPN domain